MTWIRIIPPDEAGPELADTYRRLRATYPAEYAPPVETLLKPDGTADSITQAHSLLPEAMWHNMAGFAVLMRPGLPLGRREQEMIAAVVSATNSCFY
jgi:hypothetical protein